MDGSEIDPFEIMSRTAYSFPPYQENGWPLLLHVLLKREYPRRSGDLAGVVRMGDGGWGMGRRGEGAFCPEISMDAHHLAKCLACAVVPVAWDWLPKYRYGITDRAATGPYRCLCFSLSPLSGTLGCEMEATLPRFLAGCEMDAAGCGIRMSIVLGGTLHRSFSFLLGCLLLSSLHSSSPSPSPSLYIPSSLISWPHSPCPILSNRMFPPSKAFRGRRTRVLLLDHHKDKGDCPSVELDTGYHPLPKRPMQR